MATENKTTVIDLVDVFCSGSLSGNPLAVVRGCEAFTDAQMMHLTKWLGYSETTFLLPPEHPDADYRVRIFCPVGELPFAGHPTLGTAHAWLAAGGVPRSGERGSVVQECTAGLVEVRRDDDRLAFRAPPLFRSGELSEAEALAAVAVSGAARDDVIAGVHAGLGGPWELLHLCSAEAVLAAQPAARAEPGKFVALLGACAPGGPAQFEVRAFFADTTGRVAEDPVTGSLNAAIAQYLFGSGQAEGAYVAAQGQKVGASGRVHLTQDEKGDVWVGGRVEMVSQGGTLLQPRQ